MLLHRRFLLLVISIVVLTSCAGSPASTRLSPTNAASLPKPTSSPASNVVISTYDTKRDPAHDVQLAIADAQGTDKHILLEVGGDWCIWCHYMDAFFDSHPDIREIRDQHYILVKVNFSPENENKEFLAQYPKIPGFPHLFVLDAAGKLVHSQDTSELEEGKSYNAQKFTAFLKQWAAP